MKTMLTIGKTRHCRYCGTSTIHNHGGVQEFPHKHYTLWNCAVCGDTSSELKCIVDAADFDENEQASFLMGTGRL
jgi:hypothetical protein